MTQEPRDGLLSRSSGAELIYRNAPAVTDCHWSGSPARAPSASVMCETAGGASGGATGPIPEQPIGTSLWAFLKLRGSVCDFGLFTSPETWQSDDTWTE